MNVIVELENDCPGYWVPPAGDMKVWLQTASEHLESLRPACSIVVRVVDESESADLNHRYRGNDSSTNVLSFTCELPQEVCKHLDTVPLGDLAICAPLVDSEAKQQGKSLQSHWAHLLTHGFLHLQGFQHDTDEHAQNMESIEISILEALGFTNPYIAN